MTSEQAWENFISDAWLRGGRALLLAGAVALLAWTQQHFEYSIWKLAATAFIIALPHRTFPIIVAILVVLAALALFPPAAAQMFSEFLLRLCA